MKINQKQVVVALLMIVGGVGASVAVIRGSVKTSSPAVVAGPDSSMVSMQPGSSSCEACMKGDLANCPHGGCPQSTAMTNMMTDKTMAMGGPMKSEMGENKMSEPSMTNAMSQSMNGKSMTPDMGMKKMVDGEQMVATPKM